MRKRLQNRSRNKGHAPVRLKEVAELAGCSTATVSRVLNFPERVGQQARNRVLAATEKLGYVRNGAGRALASRRTRLFGAVIPTLNYAMYARQVEALQQRLTEKGYSLLVTTSDYDLAKEFEQVRLLVERGAEGIVLVGDWHDARLHRLLESQHIPFINTYTYQADSDHPCVGFSNRRAAEQIADFLIGLGHRRIGLIAGITADNDRATERVEGVRATLEANALTLPAELVVERPYSIAGGREGLRVLFSAPKRPTAVICGNDVVAFGALIESETLGVDVPRQLSIIGFDNLEFAAHLKPPLTTVEVEAGQMGRLAGDYLISHLEGKAVAQSVHIEAKLVVRHSTVSPPAKDAFAARTKGRRRK